MHITRLTAQDHVRADGSPAPDARLLSAGRATAVSEVEIADENGTRLPTGTVGNVLVRGAFTMSGYYRNPEATAARTVGDFQNTGDRGLLDEDGYLTIVGRQTDLIITGGFNVYPAEVEHVIASIDGVRECSVFGTPDANWGESIVAAVRLEDGSGLTESQIRALVRPVLGGVKTPKAVHVVDEIPRNDTGKILKRRLAEQLYPSV